MKWPILLLFALFFSACNKQKSPQESKLPWLKENPPILPAQEYTMDSAPVLIQGARIMTAAGPIYEKANLLMEKGLIKKVSMEEIPAPTGAQIIDGTGLTLTPGILDVHSHMGVYPSPAVDAHADGNEISGAVTAGVWAEHGFWPQDPDLWRALAGGVTTIQVLPGSANLIGGRSFTAKLIPKLSAREMRFPGAPQGMKMACGENPKRVYKDKGVNTRMGNVLGYRKVYQEALEYLREWEAYNEKKSGKVPKRNLKLETLAKVLKGEILIHFHCYRADDISAILDVASEFGFKIRTIHHGLEAYKLAPRLAKEKVSVATWADWWGFKAEAFDGIPYNIALLEKAGTRAIVHSDSAVDVRFLNVEAGKALASAKKLGLDISEDKALAWITKNPAWALGLDHKIGTLEEGKMADVVAWDGHPFSIYTKTKFVFINGKLVFDRQKEQRIRSDFEVGYQDMAFNDGRSFRKVSTKQKIHWNKDNSLQKKKIDDSFVLRNVKAFYQNEWQDNTSVWVEGGKIKAINPKEVPRSLNNIDGQGRYLTPGLIESSSSLGLFEISLDSQAQDLRADTLNPTPDYRAADAFNSANLRLPIHRAEGVTTTLSHIHGGFASGFGVAFDLTEEERLLNKQVALYGTLERRSKDKNRASLWSQLKNLLREAIIYKKIKSSLSSGKTYPFENSLRHLQAMQPVIDGKVPWVITLNRADDIKKIIKLKQEFSKKGAPLKLIIKGGAESWKLGKSLVKNKIPVIVTPSEQTPTSFNKTGARFDLSANLKRQGVTVIINHSADAGTVRVRQEAGFAVKYGMDPAQALLAITEVPSQVFSLNRGKIARGEMANLVLWSADPLEPTSWAEKVWIGGKEKNLNTRHRQLAEKYLQ